MKKINEQGLSWVLLRFALEVNNFPLQYDTIHIETWIEGVGRACTNRNFCIRNHRNYELHSNDKTSCQAKLF